MSEISRPEGRALDALRPVTFQTGIAPHATGSVLVSFGRTQVICAASIESRVPRWMEEQGVEGGWITVKPPRRSPYRAQLDAFCESVREGKPARITGVDGLRAQEFVQGAYLSMRSGTWVDLPLADDAPFVIPDYA